MPATIYHHAIGLSKKLTVEGQISEKGSQQVHDEHGQKGHISNALHLSAGTAVLVEKEQMFRHRSTVIT